MTVDNNASKSGDWGQEGADGWTAGQPLRLHSTHGGQSSMAALSWLAAGTGTVGLLLYAVQQSLRLPSGFGIEDVLGWSSPDTVNAAVANWCPPLSHRWLAAAIYLLADTAFFMPFYGALLLAATLGVRNRLHEGSAPATRFMRRWLLPGTAGCLLLLWLCDGLENIGGAQRLGISSWAVLASFAIALLVAGLLIVMAAGDPAQQKRQIRRNGTFLTIALAVFAVVVLSLDDRAACSAAGTLHIVPLDLAWAHHRKAAAIALALFPIGAGAAAWWFGLDLDLNNASEKQEVQRRAAWRSGVAGVIGRTRYVLLLLGLFVAFTLVLDQCRDVLLALAGPMGSEAHRDFLSLLWRGYVLVAGAISIGMLSYSCWLWTRLVGMVRRPGLTLPAADDVSAQIGKFARGWARAMAMVPLVVVCVLLAHTAGDAVTAARSGPGTSAFTDLTRTLAYLLLFGVLIIVSALLFIEVRRGLSLRDPSDYYNSEDDVFHLLRTGTRAKPRAMPLSAMAAQPPPASGLRGRLARGAKRLATVAVDLKPYVEFLAVFARPFALPLVALALMLSLRIGMACWPSVSSQAPATLALLALALTWWLGVLGAMSMAEQRQTIPWGLAAIAVMGIFGWADFVDNHVMPLVQLTGNTRAALANLRLDGVIVTALLTALGASWWLAATYRNPETKAVRVWPRVGISVATLAAVVVGLLVVDRNSGQNFAPGTPPQGQTLASGLRKWVQTLPAVPRPPDDRIFLVASEGGGIRSAYWTAQVLAGLHDQSATFDGRVVVLSGVSGGAVGEAVYRACLREISPEPLLSDCVKTRFAHLDALSPLIGGFLFEDAFARILPLNLPGAWSPCKLPGCGHLSRALGFEREWIRQFPHLGDALGPSQPGEPALMLNSTLIESGNRATFSTLRLTHSETPSSEDAVRLLGTEPSLIAAAHAAARFPFINPLGTIVPASAPASGPKIVGHVADGGYHDNSGAEALADAWRALQGVGIGPAWRPQLILIRNGRVKSDCSPLQDAEPAVSCLTTDPGRTVDLTAPSTTSRWNLYVDALGPAVAVVNVSGVGVHSRQAVATLSADIATAAPKDVSGVPPLPVWILDQTTDAKLVPLGWYLSPAAREALDAQVACALARFPLLQNEPATVAKKGAAVANAPCSSP